MESEDKSITGVKAMGAKDCVTGYVCTNARGYDSLPRRSLKRRRIIVVLELRKQLFPTFRRWTRDRTRVGFASGSSTCFFCIFVVAHQNMSSCSWIITDSTELIYKIPKRKFLFSHWRRTALHCIRLWIRESHPCGSKCINQPYGGFCCWTLRQELIVTKVKEGLKPGMVQKKGMIHIYWKFRK